MDRAIRILCLVCLPLLTGGCASAARAERMVPPPLPATAGDSRLHGAIALAKVGGGEPTSALGTSKVGDEDLAEALRRSLEQNGYLWAGGGDAPFALEAFLIELKEPTAPYTKIVDSFIRYRLVAARGQRVVFDEIVTASFTATLGDAVVGIVRQRLAKEGSIRANIASFLSRLDTLDIDTGAAR